MCADLMEILSFLISPDSKVQRLLYAVITHSWQKLKYKRNSSFGHIAHHLPQKIQATVSMFYNVSIQTAGELTAWVPLVIIKPS